MTPTTPSPEATRGAVIRRLSESAVMAVLGGILLWYHASALVVHYLREDFRPYMLWGGVGLLVVAAFHAWFAKARVSGESTVSEARGGLAGPAAWVVWLVAMVPIFAGLAFTTHKYSTSAAARKGLFDDPASLASGAAIMNATALLEYAQQSPDGYYQLALDQVFFTALYEEDRNLLQGTMIELDAMATVRPGATNSLRLYDLMVMCCAADARAVGVDARFDTGIPEDLVETITTATQAQEATWIRVQGTLDFEQTQPGRWAAFVVVDTHEIIPAPATPFDDM
ncbi:hypothetical protein [Sulfuriroseicoccus oceanibius]|uniref:TIGR03943 family protein n=1 Tax=Sulfuriroseicoccus oceanibius TaxID=2707525 RepID=A0A6B3L693_9BACT|nr:hypothetical protein [Sulfuriroseicoccus oceanibius]QQL44759.1 hypothetical protein G3M56_012895 [Sulfuriroseicoccus oceanibius]